MFRSLSSFTPLRWQAVEFADGVFAWTNADALISQALAAGATVLGTFHGDGNVPPSWCLDTNAPVFNVTPTMPLVDKWLRYVSNCVTRYKDDVHDWEIWNEPQYQLYATQYVTMMTNATAMIRAIDPTARVVGWGGIADTTGQRQWLQEAQAYMGPQWYTNMDIAAAHVYTDIDLSAGGSMSNLVYLLQPLEVWNTESGTWCLGSRLGVEGVWNIWSSATRPYYEQRIMAEGNIDRPLKGAYTFWKSLGDGAKKFFYYDSRLTDRVFEHHPTDIDADDGLRMKGAIMGIAASFVNGFTTSTNCGGASHHAYAFSGGQVNPVAVLWSQVTNLTVTFSTNLWVADLMGNWLHQTNAVVVGNEPVYVIGTNVGYEPLIAALKSATVATNADTHAPYLIVTKPDNASGTNFWRWYAVDDCDIPEALDAKIDYSWRESSGDWSAWEQKVYAFSSATNISVRARDKAGNISSAFSYTTSSTPPPQPEPQPGNALHLGGNLRLGSGVLLR